MTPPHDDKREQAAAPASAPPDESWLKPAPPMQAGDKCPHCGSVDIQEWPRAAHLYRCSECGQGFDRPYKAASAPPEGIAALVQRLVLRVASERQTKRRDGHRQHICVTLSFDEVEQITALSSQLSAALQECDRRLEWLEALGIWRQRAQAARAECDALQRREAALRELANDLEKGEPDSWDSFYAGQLEGSKLAAKGIRAALASPAPLQE